MSDISNPGLWLAVRGQEIETLASDWLSDILYTARYWLAKEPITARQNGIMTKELWNCHFMLVTIALELN